MQIMMIEFVAMEKAHSALLHSDMHRNNPLPTPAAACLNEQ
jgi:hypothetical protein